MKNSIDTIGNRTRDLPACSAVPQPTGPLRSFISRDRNKSDFSKQQSLKLIQWHSVRRCLYEVPLKALL
jgi:hypothetical protein